jgi:hypothetical protein
VGRDKMKRIKKEVIAILCADIHLQHRVPILRSKERDWYDCMRQALYWLQETQRLFGDCPIIAAGDIFDYWNSCPELINFAMTYMPNNMFCIPGQHDTPHHNQADLDKSAYYSLVLSNTITDLERVETQPLIDFNLCAFGYGDKIQPPDYDTSGVPSIAICHKYVWYGKSRYKIAPKREKVTNIAKKNMIDRKLFGFDIMVFGDNHKGFLMNVGKTTVFNCGTFMRRHSTDLDCDPQVGLLHPDGTITPIRIDMSKDVYLERTVTKKLEDHPEIDISELSSELKSIDGQDVDFELILRNYLKKQGVKINKRTEELLLKAASGKG